MKNTIIITTPLITYILLCFNCNRLNIPLNETNGVDNSIRKMKPNTQSPKDFLKC